MTTQILIRAAQLTPGEGRTIYGVCVPYGVVAQVSDGGRPYRERVEYGACARSISERGHKVRLFTMHDRQRLPIGKAVELTEKRDGLHGAFEVANTVAGNDALELVRSGVVDAFSIGFKGIREHLDGDVVVRTEIAVMEVSLVGIPAFEGAQIAGVRSQKVIPRTVAERRLKLLKLQGETRK
jgi:HK97 family phage prohead protease